MGADLDDVARLLEIIALQQQEILSWLRRIWERVSEE